MVGEKLEEYVLAANKEFSKDTIEMCKTLFNELPEKIKNDIIVEGVINTLNFNFQDNEKIKKFINQVLLKNERPLIKKFIRYD
ncbi:hypothetical protein ACFHWD_12550 [Clostridium sp. MT-14]|jgi:hypothetical protein|uniref:hypothetical protein n=1 Tax=unclassified Clostridium TaxID=2614128 RepID=UPI0012393468|nr:hypothetical protein [Clostridium sp. HV4-5-A1G]KAA8664194.1 hypothetical protein F3O63_17955 [Clostridium sp. HV4-5-A1G]